MFCVLFLNIEHHHTEKACGNTEKNQYKNKRQVIDECFAWIQATNFVVMPVSLRFSGVTDLEPPATSTETS